MILLCGIPTESPITMVNDALRQLGHMPVMFNQRRFATTAIELTLSGDQIRGWLHIDDAHFRLEEFTGVYVRLMDDRLLPELEGKAFDSPERTYCRRLHETLSLWLELTEARIVNRATSMMSNNSKPYQAQLIRELGLLVPATVVTNDPERVLAFRRQYGRVIYKSISGVRSIVQEFTDKDLDRLDKIRWCPTQFQEFVEGENVRVHIVADNVFPTRIRSKAVDYRYAHEEIGEAAELEECDLPSEVAAQCVALAKGLGLAFAGIDLMLTKDGRYYCFEVNPSPGFSYYEANTGQPIALAVAKHLIGSAGADS
jgi:hypothetical protein